MLLIPLIISILLLCISIYIILNLFNTKNSNYLLSSFDKLEQIEIYKKFISERLTLYFQGQILGYIISIIFIKSIKNYNILIFSLLIYFSSLLFLIFYPKKYNILDNLTSTRQNILWRKISNEITKKFILASILNIFAFIIIGKIIKIFL